MSRKPRPLNLPGEDPDTLYPDFLADHLESLGRRYQRFNDGETLLEALQGAATFRVPAPIWCLTAIKQIMASWKEGKHREFGETIGIKRAPGWRQADHRNKYRKIGDIPTIGAVYLAVKKAHAEGLPLNIAPGSEHQASAFSAAATQFSIGAKTAEKWYYEVKHAREELERSLKRLVDVTKDKSPEYLLDRMTAIMESNCTT